MESSYVSFRDAARDLKGYHLSFDLYADSVVDGDGDLDVDVDGRNYSYGNNNNYGRESGRLPPLHLVAPDRGNTATTEVLFGAIDESFVEDECSAISSQSGSEKENQYAMILAPPQYPTNNAPKNSTAEVGYSTPNASMLDDSLLVHQGEVLHEIPVTPVKGKRPPSSALGMYNCGNIDTSQAMVCLEVMPEEPEPVELQVGDHVYQWRSWMGIPGVFQHHGIVMDIIQDQTTGERKLTIADFSNVPEAAKKEGRTGLTQEGIMRTYTDTDKWHKVTYEAAWWKRSLYRAGTCTSAKSDAVGLILARVHFIIQHPDSLPDYHVVHANCECVAFWCKTGTWSTLQAASLLEMAAAGQAKSAATLAGVASTTQVSVPAAGMWGWFGYTTQVSYLSVHPVVLPALAGYAVVTVGIPAVMYANARKKWKETSQRLSDAFWGSALENPEVFAECLTHWSEKR